MSIINQTEFQRDLDYLVSVCEIEYTDSIEKKVEEISNKYFQEDPEYLWGFLFEELGNLPNNYQQTIYYTIQDGKRITSSTPTPYSVLFYKKV